MSKLSLRFTHRASPAPRSGWLRRFPPSALWAAGTLLVIVLACAVGPELSHFDGNRNDLRNTLRPPSAEHWLGTDQFGRDTSTRLLLGGRLTFLVGIASTAFGTILGVLLGVLGGFFGGVIEGIAMRTVDLLLALPGLLLSLTLVAVLGFGLESLIVAIGLAATPVIARVTHGATMQVARRDYVEAARVLGVSSARLLFRHVLPNIAPAIISIATVRWGKNILLAAALNFFGVGVQPPAAEWGLMIAEGRVFLSNYPSLVLFPALLIVATSLALNTVGDGLQAAGQASQGRHLR